MTVKHFKYTKKKTGEVKKYTVLVLRDTDNYLGGIDFTKLTQPEMEEVTKIQMEYEKVLQPFVKKAFRNFIKNNIEDDDGNT